MGPPSVPSLSVTGDIVLSQFCLEKAEPSLVKDPAARGHGYRAVSFDLCINNGEPVARANGISIGVFQMLLLVLLLEDYFKLTSVSWKPLNNRMLFPICKQSGE